MSSRALAIYPTYHDESLLSTSENPLRFAEGAIFAARSMRRIALARMTPLMRVFSILDDRSPRAFAMVSVSHERLIAGPHPLGYPPIPIAI